MLKPLRIGPIAVDFPLMLASLAGYSDMPYRLICRSLGAPYCTTEALIDRLVRPRGKRNRRIIAPGPEDHPIAGQLLGSVPADMARAAANLRDMGFDAVDLNFACPVRKVLARNRGGYLMTQPELALEIVRAVVAAVPGLPVTLKMRIGFDANDRGGEAFWTIAGGAFEAGAAALFVHARTVDQKYHGGADWEFLARVKKEFADRTIVGSGDVHEATDVLRMIRETGVDGVLAARGAIGNPWIFRQARDLAAGREPRRPSVAEQRDVIERHFAIASETYGAARGLHVIRSFMFHYARVHPDPAAVRKRTIPVKTERDWRRVMEEMYGG